MTLTFGTDALCRYCKGSANRRDGADCGHCQGTGFEPSNVAPARRDSPATSKAAAASLSSEAITHAQGIVLSVLKEFGPMSDERLYRYARVTKWMSASGARTRRAELTSRGLIVDTGRTEKTERGRDSVVWAAR